MYRFDEVEEDHAFVVSSELAELSNHDTLRPAQDEREDDDYDDEADDEDEEREWCD